MRGAGRDEMKIERVEVKVIGAEEKRWTWSEDLPEQYQSNLLLRIFTDDGVEGLAGVWNATSYGYDRYTAESLRHLLPILIGRDPRQREAILFDLRARVFPQPPGALAVIDNALWDLTGKLAGLPVHQLLGGARDRIRSYASTPMYEDVPAYMRKIEEFIEMGFTAVKFHTWCIPDWDLELAREARRQFPKMDFMLDAENNYDRASSLRVGRELQDLNFFWFEAPLHDSDIDGYRELATQLAIPVIPSGNWVQDLSLFAETIKIGVWKTTRTDMHMMGGITPMQKVMGMCQAAGINCEIMSWGYTLPSAANLHLMLGNRNCTLYEQPLPYETFEYGMNDVLRTQPDGYVYGPTGPGLGLEVDWKAMDAAIVHQLSCDRNGIG